MERLLLLAFIIAGIIACNSNGESQDGDEKSKKISSRDYSITRQFSYSDLFVDSLAVEKYIADKKVPDSISRRMRSFYNTRNFQFAWFTSGGLTEEARGFWNLHDYATTHEGDSALIDKPFQKRMEKLMAEDQLNVGATASYINTELTMTRHFLMYMLRNYEKGYVKRKEMERFIPRKKEDALAMADSLVNKKHKDDKYFEDVNETYRALKEQLARYVTIVKQGGWPTVATSKQKWKKGMSDPRITLIKKRLSIVGDLIGGDTSQVYNDTLVAAIKNYQQRLGYTPTGHLSDSIIREMNVPAIDRLKQILINLGRMRWMATDVKGTLIVVNIPEFIMHVYDGNTEAFNMVVVVGKEGHNTMMFNGDLNQVVFSPYWNVPSSIVKNEILPEIEKDPGYLESQNMETTGEEEGLPVIRQRPGGQNALGRVKFLFPNSFNIYFHDTPAKSLFQKDKRAYSHGCIRVKEPAKLAAYVLRDQPEWTASRIEEAMNSGEEKFVRVKNPIPVIITYYTAWVDGMGRLNFREDIYGHDASLAAKMFR